MTANEITSERALIEVWNLRRSFDEDAVQALRGVSFTIGQGEFVSVRGPSGSGKTTLLNVVGALDTHFEGNVVIERVPEKGDHETGCAGLLVFEMALHEPPFDGKTFSRRFIAETDFCFAPQLHNAPESLSRSQMRTRHFFTEMRDARCEMRGSG